MRHRAATALAVTAAASRAARPYRCVPSSASVVTSFLTLLPSTCSTYRCFRLLRQQCTLLLVGEGYNAEVAALACDRQGCLCC